VVPVRVPGLSQTVATPHNGSARKAAVLYWNNPLGTARWCCAEWADLARKPAGL